MQYATYITYKDIKGIDISFNECIFKIKIIFKRYKRETILSFLGHVSQEIGLENSFESSKKVQETLGIEIKGILVHSRAILVLYQIFFEETGYSVNNNDIRLTNEEHFYLFLFANQILSKKDFTYEYSKSGEVTIGHLIGLMRLYVGIINSFETNLVEELFLKFYIKLTTSKKYSIYDEVIFKNTGLRINDFIKILEDFRKPHMPSSIFSTYDKFAVLNYDEIYGVWDRRSPKINIPLEYRFFELYPLIKREKQYYPTSAMLLFVNIIRKIYHVLSNDEQTKGEFRAFWGTSIVEPVIKEYVKNIFETSEVKVIDRESQKKIGMEITDIMLINADDIFLVEIKSGYMALSHRYTDDQEIFKTNFEKKYILNSSGKHQLINQLDIFDNYYDKFADLYSLDKNIKYKVFSTSLVFDEALSMIGFKRYLGKVFNDNLNPKFSKYTKFLPYLYSNLLTFAELLTFEKRIPDKNKRIVLLKNLFAYHDSFWDLLDDIKDNQIKVEGIQKDDIV